MAQQTGTYRSVAILVTAFIAALTVRASGQNAEPLYLDGSVVIMAVDDRRVLIAVDSDNEGLPEDGQIDHLFFFTASEPIQLPLDVKSRRAHLEFDGNTLRVQQSEQVLVFGVRPASSSSPDRVGTTRFERSIGLSHYWGWSGFTMKDLEQVRRSNRCPNACYEAAGHALRFPA